MRLICPNCDAQYEIDPDLVPEGGRDVECSSCSKVWFQGKEPISAPAPAPQMAAPTLPPPSQRLNESVLAVLREEAARELRARQADRAEVIENKSNEDVSLVALPGTSKPESATPAASITVKAAAEQTDAQPAPDLFPVPPRPHVDQAAMPPHAPLPPKQKAPATVPPASSSVDESPRPSQENTQPGPHQVNKNVTPAAAPSSSPAAVPSATATTSRSGGYAAGFALALAVMAAMASAYLIAPNLSKDSAIGQILTGFRAEADKGRVWFHRQITRDSADRL